MRTILIWVCIAIVGIVLYSIPPYVQSFEGFDTPTIDVNRERALADLQTLLNSTPNFVQELPDMAPVDKSLPNTVPSQMSPSNALKQGAAFQSIQDLSGAMNPISRDNLAKPDTTRIHRSKPQECREPTPKSDALKQGKEFQAAQDILVENIQGSSRPPVCPTPVCPKPVCPTPVCPKCPACKKIPNPCPDMQAYIRKDNIPCWGCKL